MSSRQDLSSHQTTSTTHPQRQSGSLPPSTFTDLTEGQTAEEPLSTQITSDHPPNTPSKRGRGPATGSQSTPMSYRVASSRSVSKHLASDLDQFLKEELDGMIATVDAEHFLQFALPDSQGSKPLDTPEWKALTDKIDANEEQRKLKQAWNKAQPETEKYTPFCRWVETLLTFIDSCPCTLSRQRQIRFTPLGSQNIRCTPAYVDGEEVGGTESSFRPDAACVMGNVTLLEGWWQVLVPLEFKRRRCAQRPKGATPSVSTSGPKGPGVPQSRTSGQKRSRSHCADDSTSEIPQNKSRRVTQPSSSNQPDDPTSGSYSKNVRRETLSHRFTQDPGSATPTTTSYTATKDDLQLARYAMETLAAVGDRTHVFGLAVNSDNSIKKPLHTITLWYFDRCGAIRSYPLDVNMPGDLGAFIKFLAALVYMKDDALGFNPFFPDRDLNKPVPREGLCGMSVSIPGDGDRPLELLKVLDRRTGMVGRATLVHLALLPVGKESTCERDVVVLKSSWQHSNRSSESAILKELHENKDDQAHKYLVEWYAGWEQGYTGGNSQRAKFGLDDIVVHDRVLRHTVVEYLNPITKLAHPSHVRHVGWSILHAIKFLDDKEWFHRDISLGNMGFATLRDCQGVVVKLHDFDLSKRHESPPANPHWTGTLPFVAIALLENQDADHQIGFDVEALMWTLLWIVRVYEEGTTVNTPVHPHPLKNWFWNCESLSDIAAHKKAYLLGEPPHPWTNDFYKDLEPDMRSLATMWSDLLWDQTKARRQKGGDFLSDKVYGKPGFLSIQGWMKGEGWDEPWERCLCKHHCAE